MPEESSQSERDVIDSQCERNADQGDCGMPVEDRESDPNAFGDTVTNKESGRGQSGGSVEEAPLKEHDSEQPAEWEPGEPTEEFYSKGENEGKQKWSKDGGYN
jgi:hypothetical protein